MAREIKWTKVLYNRKDWDWHIDGLIKEKTRFIIGRQPGGILVLKDLKKNIEYKRPNYKIVSKQNAMDLAKDKIDKELILFI